MRTHTGQLTITGIAALSLVFGSAVAYGSPAPNALQTADAPTSVYTCDQATAVGVAHCLAIQRTDPDSVQPSLAPGASPGGLSPGNLRSAYQLTNATGGSGNTVAIIDAYDDPNAEADLTTYRAQYALPACTTANGCFKKINQNGATSPLPVADYGWAGEISLDVDMVSAICPSCHILLVEATTSSFTDLGASVNTAVAQGAKYVSNSYGGSEFTGESNLDSSYYRHPGVAVTASTGDNGYGTSYPATSPYVTAVGGTSLTAASTPRGWTETAWNGAGSGCSATEPKPAFQTAATGCTTRANADVSAVADPNTGVAVYQTYGANGWSIYGGTSVSSPIIASVYALAGTPGAADIPAAYPYTHTSNLNDITSGTNGTCSPAVECTATTGWDGPTGLGTPNGTAAFTNGNTTSTCPTPGQKLGNPSFETTPATPWQTTPGVISANGSGEIAHTGTHYAWLDGYGTKHTDTVTQSMTIPTGCTATLSFYLHVDTAETGRTAVDTLTISAGATLATFSNLNAAAGYTQHTYDLTSLAGHTATLTFTGTEDTQRATSFVLDDATLTLS